MSEELLWDNPLQHRERQVAPPHHVTVELQILHTLLRIEELLSRDDTVKVEGELTDHLKGLKPAMTPFLEAEKAKTTAGKRKGSRQL